jgi:hypothetical protein
MLESDHEVRRMVAGERLDQLARTARETGSPKSDVKESQTEARARRVRLPLFRFLRPVRDGS